MTTGPYVPADDQDREDRRKHLDHIQGIVNRLATASATIKGWSITLAGAAFGVGAVRSNWYLYILGLVALAAFAVLDSHYLNEERKYRHLHAATRENYIERFCLNTQEVPDGFVTHQKSAWKSWSVTKFYLPLLLAGLVLAGIGLSQPTDEPVDRGHHHEQDQHSR